MNELVPVCRVQKPNPRLSNISDFGDLNQISVCLTLIADSQYADSFWFRFIKTILIAKKNHRNGNIRFLPTVILMSLTRKDL